tara:strand:+ start:3563 stop:4978 length:1416 start_codon:yes stop_codon:yes gene_type:complete
MERIHLYALLHEPLLLDDSRTLLPKSNIIDLESSRLEGNKFYLAIEDSWYFQPSEDNIKALDILYSIKQFISVNPNPDGEYLYNENEMIENISNEILLTLTKDITLGDSLEILNKLRKVYAIPYSSGKDFENNNSSTAGPFQWSEYSTQKITLTSEYSDSYYPGKPQIETIEILEVPFSLNIPSKMKNEQLDLMLDANYFDYQEFKNQDDKFKTEELPSLTMNLLFFNFHNKIFDDIEIREAMNIAIDKKAILKAFNSTATALYGPVPSRNVYYNNEMKGEEHNRDKSIQLFRRLGYKKKNNHIIGNDGKKIKFNLYCSDKMTTTEMQIRDLIIEDLVDIGLTIKVIPRTPMLLKRALINKPEKWDLYYSTTKIEKRQFIDNYFYSKKSDNLNYGNYKNLAIDKLFGHFNRTDGSARLKIGPEIHKMLTEDFACIPLVASNNWIIYESSLTPIIKPYYIFSKPHRWRFKQD